MKWNNILGMIICGISGLVGILMFESIAILIPIVIAEIGMGFLLFD
jgi:hypothetical protein